MSLFYVVTILIVPIFLHNAYQRHQCQNVKYDTRDYSNTHRGYSFLMMQN